MENLNMTLPIILFPLFIIGDGLRNLTIFPFLPVFPLALFKHYFSYVILMQLEIKVTFHFLPCLYINIIHNFKTVKTTSLLTASAGQAERPSVLFLSWS